MISSCLQRTESSAYDTLTRKKFCQMERSKIVDGALTVAVFAFEATTIVLNVLHTIFKELTLRLRQIREQRRDPSSSTLPEGGIAL